MHVEKRNHFGNCFTENWVIKFLKGSHGKLLICFQVNFFTFLSTCLWTRAMFLVFWICHFLCKLRVFRGTLSSDKSNFSSQNVWFFLAYWCISYCFSHPNKTSMQILSEYTLPHILDTSMEVFNRFFYWVKNWLRQWKSRISGDRVVGAGTHKKRENKF